VSSDTAAATQRDEATGVSKDLSSLLGFSTPRDPCLLADKQAGDRNQ